jgi:hypothetical protein
MAQAPHRAPVALALVAVLLYAGVSARAQAPAPAVVGTPPPPAVAGTPPAAPAPVPPAVVESPPTEIRPAPLAPPKAAAPVLVAPAPAPAKRRYLYQRWPFWAVTGGLLVGMLVLTYAVTRPPPEPYHGTLPDFDVP